MKPHLQIALAPDKREGEVLIAQIRAIGKLTIFPMPTRG